MLQKLIGKNFVVYDLEIKNEIDGVNVTWKTKDKMGLSVGALFDYRTGDYSVYFEENAPELAERLNEADMIIGFNTVDFDNELLRVHAPKLKPAEELKNFDMLVASRKACGGGFLKGLKLDDHLLGTFGEDFMKTGHGAEAPKWWQQGLKAKVTSYCIADVRREKTLFEHIIEHGWVITPTHGQKKIDLSAFEAYGLS